MNACAEYFTCLPRFVTRNDSMVLVVVCVVLELWALLTPATDEGSLKILAPQ
jgi:hypothetical protein